MASWFDENSPPDPTYGITDPPVPGGTGASIPIPDQSIGRIPLPGQPGQPTGPLTKVATGGAPPQVNRQDPASVAAYVNYYAQQPGANPSLARDPNYWIQKISSGEFGDDPGYYVSKFMTPEGAPAGQGNPSGINGPFGATPFDFKFSENDPSYQFLKKEVLDSTANSQFAQGTGLTGGAAKELQNRAGGLASAEYQNEFDRQFRTNQLNFGQGLAANQNYFGQNFSLAGLGLNATTADINAAGGQASQGSSYANNVSGLYGDRGNAEATGIVGGANARNRFYASLLNGMPSF